ncbi:MAG: hypothetical protein ABL929_07030 [Ferruginibacter sp.]|nr:DUF4878 domain-containing protein [Ferruginibacter sp.]
MLQKNTIANKCISLIILCNIFTACTEQKTKHNNTAMDVGRDFIRATLDGNFKDAETLLFADSQNVQLFNSYKRVYSNFTNTQKNAYKNASYTILTINEENDSTSIINYSNSYKNIPQNIKIVKKNKVWAIDFKHTYSDTTILK